MAYINPCEIDRNGLLALAESKRLVYAPANTYTGVVTANYPNTTLTEKDFSADYISVPFVAGQPYDWVYSYDTYHIDTKFVYDKEFRHACFVKVPVSVYMAGNDSGNVTDYYLFMYNKYDGSHGLGYECSISSTQNNARNVVRVYNDRVDNVLTNSYVLSTHGYVINNESDFNTFWSNFESNVAPYGVGIKAKLNDIRTGLNDTFGVANFNTDLQTLTQIGFINKAKNMLWRFDSLGLPVFDYTQTDDIIEFLRTGDDSGSIDPFDPENPELIEVTDFNTNFKTFWKSSKRGSVTLRTVAYNDEWIALENRYQQCGLFVFYRQYADGLTPPPWVYLTESVGIGYPTSTYTVPIDTGVHKHKTDVLLIFTDKNDNSKGVASRIDLQYDGTKETLFKVTHVGYFPDWYTAPSLQYGTDRVSIPDGYKYTESITGYWHEIYFRDITGDDIINYTPDGTDTESDETGETVDTGISNGMLTFSIDNAKFKAVNNALWSTDWTQVFKSNTSDPVQCVISCKSIPFTANALGSSDIVIANLNTGVHANTVKQAKTTTIITGISIPNLKNDFTDYLCKIKCWLPFIGWVELPANEVVGRVAVPNAGLTAHPKRLGFKYITDFVDGNCRCIVSVNDTERWCFDGNCAIDIPVTSDGHTNAVSNAIRSGVGAVLSVGSAVASGYAGNALGVVGGVASAAQNVANSIPTYSYSSSCSPSGYIESSMNDYIMLVIERPIVINDPNLAHQYGKPCNMVYNLGALTGYTKCNNVNLSTINCTPYERTKLKSILESGFYL